MKAKSSNFFWPSFTDLMTSLFFIMLVLYVLTYLKLTNQQRATEEQLNEINEIQAAIKELPKDYFAYDTTNKRFSLVRQIEFEKGKDSIQPKDTSYLIKVGKAIRDLIDTLKIKSSELNIKYVVIIEGMASKDPYPDNYQLSYKRAWAVQKLWNEKVMLDSTVCEIQIAGSGTGGIGRFSGAEEIKNQRILIQIVPKIGRIDIE